MLLSLQRVNKNRGRKGHSFDITNFFIRVVHWLLYPLCEHSLTKEVKSFFIVKFTSHQAIRPCPNYFTQYAALLLFSFNSRDMILSRHSPTQHSMQCHRSWSWCCWPATRQIWRTSHLTPSNNRRFQARTQECGRIWDTHKTRSPTATGILRQVLAYYCKVEKLAVR
jgi:hypothetical protein